DIEARRAQMSDLLIFDILLSSGGLRQPDALYPPADAPALHRLLDAILHESTYDALKKDCLVYFLLKWHQDGREERFKDDRCIPPQFAMLSDAYWHLDSGIHVARAVSLLADVRLNRDFTSKIIQAISLSPNPSPLILQYLRTTKPLLTEPDDIDTYILALAESSLVEAWSYQRSFPEASATRKRLIHKVLEFCLARTCLHTARVSRPDPYSNCSFCSTASCHRTPWAPPLLLRAVAPPRVRAHPTFRPAAGFLSSTPRPRLCASH
ncbi:hypothetical protein FA95DRAFT_1483960, partial [Auriscalpium vulgare]